MNLLSLLIAPVQYVVLFFAPHAVTAHAVTTKTTGVRLPSRWLAAAPSGASAACAPGHTALRASHSAQAIGPVRLPAARITYPRAVAHVTAKPIHRVRVVRNVDTALPADRAGRMVVSGRFADVCAELDRLAAMGMRSAA